jgi:hypothetical protein
MTAYNATALLDELSSDIRTILVYTETLKTKTEDELNKPAADGGWSAAQVLAHLNFYASYYLPEIEKALSNASTNTKPFYKSGWLGNYFANLMAPKADGQVKSKMKSPKNAVPADNLNAKQELETFIAYQHQFLNALEIAKKTDLSSARIATSLTTLIKLKLGDTFRFVIAHEQRHVEQMRRLFV